jgi:hypothetical protein
MSHEIVGKWRVTAITGQDKWIWWYTFDSDGAVRWRDPLNDEAGQGKWSATGKSIAISWAPQSTTKEYWYLPISPTFQTGESSASYGNGTIVAERVTRGADDDGTPRFIKPKWASSSAGAKLTSNGTLWRQELDLGGSASIGFVAGKDLVLRMQNPAVAKFSQFPDPAGNARGIDVVGTQPGDSYFEAIQGDTVIAQMQIHVSNIPASKAVYIDDFTTAYYDPDYRHQGGNFSQYVLAHFPDDVVVAVPMNQIGGAGTERTDAARAAAAQSIKSGRVGEGGRFFPAALNAGTTPRLYIAKQQAVEIIETENVKIIRSSRDAAMFIVSLGPMAIGGPLSPRRRISRSQAPRSVRNATEGAGGGGGAGSGAKGASAAIEGNTVRLGSPGEAGNLFAGIESTSKGTVYRVDMIVLEGEEAAVATARATHREMIKRSAQTARNAGQSQFKMVGKQAGANFRAHADRLAQEIGVAGSGKSVSSGGFSDYEVVLDVGKTLAQ